MKKVMVIDDSMLIRAYVKVNLEKIGFQVIPANDGSMALTLLRNPGEVLPDIIFCDINMPKMNGLEFLHELRNDRDLKKTPVIVLTTSDEDKDRIEAYNLNVAGYILKPVTFTNFAEVMMALNKYWTLCEMP